MFVWEVGQFAVKRGQSLDSQNVDCERIYAITQSCSDFPSFTHTDRIKSPLTPQCCIQETPGLTWSYLSGEARRTRSLGEDDLVLCLRRSVWLPCCSLLWQTLRAGRQHIYSNLQGRKWHATLQKQEWKAFCLYMAMHAGCKSRWPPAPSGLWAQIWSRGQVDYIKGQVFIYLLCGGIFILLVRKLVLPVDRCAGRQTGGLKNL